MIARSMFEYLYLCTTPLFAHGEKAEAMLVLELKNSSAPRINQLIISTGKATAKDRQEARRIKESKGS